jgi:UDP-2,3-diacylglucosamine pyrophosphatase LpxH
MGSSMSKIYDDLEEEQWHKDKEWLQQLAEKIKNINPSSQEFRDLIWMEKNSDRILGNRKLIELLR